MWLCEYPMTFLLLRNPRGCWGLMHRRNIVDFGAKLFVCLFISLLASFCSCDLLPFSLAYIFLFLVYFSFICYFKNSSTPFPDWML